jgi:mono/diheme cytochrome c family protein
VLTAQKARLTKIMFAVELATMVAGVVATAGVLVKSHVDTLGRRHDDSIASADARSACHGATGTLALLRAWLDGAELPLPVPGFQPPIDDAVRARGAALFARHCATCHGVRGSGDGPTAAQLTDRPATLSNGVYELRTTEHDSLPTDRDLFRTITEGVHGTGMPPWFALPERDRWALVAHIKTLSKEFEEDEAPPPIEPRAPAPTPERVAHGAQLYRDGGCASCHGASGRGDGPAASSLVYQSGEPVKPRDLRLGRFHRSTRLADIYTTIATGLDGTPMASFAKVMSPDDLWDVALYVQGLAPRFLERSDGLRCPQAPIARDPDEAVGLRMLMHSLQPTN